MMIKNLTPSLVSIMFSLTLFTALTFTSCKKDDSVTPKNVSNLSSVSLDSTASNNNVDKQNHSGSYISNKPATGTTTGTTTGTVTGTKTGTTTPPVVTPPVVTPPVVTPPVVTPPVVTYKTTAPINLNNASNMTISGDLITGGSLACISLMNCSNIHITKCKLQNSTLQGIMLYNCTNITIDSCFITNVEAGVDAMKSTTIKVINNQFLNMNGPFPSGNFVQFDNVNGGGNQINYNKCEDIAGVAQHPQDGLSVYQSNGLPGDSIQVIGNWIRGGQVQHDSGGAAGIVLGDVGGSYQVARNNILVNPGAVGAQVQGGNHIKIDHNTIYSVSTPYTVLGIAYGNYSHLSSTDVIMSYNKVKYYNTAGNEVDEWWDPNTVIQPVGWATNIQKASIDATILPATIITMK